MPSLVHCVLGNGLWLLAPVMVWNVACAARLPPAFAPPVFNRDIPSVITIPENVLRLTLFALPSVTVVGAPGTPPWGYAVFGAGIAAYVASWLALMYRPDGRWSRSAAGFTAPAWTPAVWLVGIALVTTSFVGQAALVRWAFVALGVAFLSFHIAHVTVVYRRAQPRAA